jgi:putative endonuclease
VAEINGLLNRRTTLKLYRGFESLPHRKMALYFRAFFMYYVYILYSSSIQQYYCGQTGELATRLIQHNSGLTLSNKHGIPWELVGFLYCETRSEAMKLERQIKKRGIKRWIENNQQKIIKPA